MIDSSAQPMSRRQARLFEQHEPVDVSPAPVDSSEEARRTGSDRVTSPQDFAAGHSPAAAPAVDESQIVKRRELRDRPADAPRVDLTGEIILDDFRAAASVFAPPVAGAAPSWAAPVADSIVSTVAPQVPGHSVPAATGPRTSEPAVSELAIPELVNPESSVSGPIVSGPIVSGPIVSDPIDDSFGHTMSRRELRALRETGQVADTSSEMPPLPVMQDAGPGVLAPDLGLSNSAGHSSTVLPSTVSPNAASPGTVSPNAASPGTVSPNAVSPSAVSPGAGSPNTESAGAATTGNGGWSVPTGHWTQQLAAQDDEVFGVTVGRTVGGGPGTSSTLIVAQTPQIDLSAPLSATGEIMLTGSIPLPEEFGRTGATGPIDQVEDFLDPYDVEPPSQLRSGSMPVSAVAAATGPFALGTPMVSKRRRGGGGKMLTALLVVASSLAVIVTGLIIAAFAMGMI